MHRTFLYLGEKSNGNIENFLFGNFDYSSELLTWWQPDMALKSKQACKILVHINLKEDKFTFINFTNPKTKVHNWMKSNWFWFNPWFPLYIKNSN